MAFGAEVKNRAGSTVIGTRNLSLRYAGSGTVRPAFQEGSAVNDTLHNAAGIGYPYGVSPENVYIFAKPVPYEPNIGIYETEDTVRQNSVCTFGIRMNVSGWAVVAPARYENQSNPTPDSKDFHRSNEVWGTTSTTGEMRVYYEMWTVDNTDDENEDTGLLVKDSSNDIIYSTNRSVFRPEKIVTNSRPRITVTGDTTVGFTGSYNIFLDDTSNAAQREYLAFMNGCAALSGITYGQNAGSGMNMPNDGKAEFQPMTRWYFYDHNDKYMRKPYVQWVCRRAFVGSYSSTTYDGQTRYATNMSMNALGMIGVTK